jgi:hypothetical protein
VPTRPGTGGSADLVMVGDVVVAPVGVVGEVDLTTQTPGAAQLIAGYVRGD